jgi:Ca2+-binding RTX toxin-like protein
MDVVVDTGVFDDVHGVRVEGGGGDDTVFYAFGELFTGGASGRPDVPMTLLGGAGNDCLLGGSADDLIVGGAGDDTILGGAGNDALVDDGRTVTESAGEDDAPLPYIEDRTLVLKGTAYADTITVHNDEDLPDNYYIHMYDEWVLVPVDLIDGIRIEGGAGNDSLGVFDEFHPLGVPVTIVGGEGDDLIGAGSGETTVDDAADRPATDEPVTPGDGDEVPADGDGETAPAAPPPAVTPFGVAPIDDGLLGDDAVLWDLAD